MNETYKLRTIGGALMVTIPQWVVRQCELKAGDAVTIVTTKDRTIMLRRERNGTPKPKVKGK